MSQFFELRANHGFGAALAHVMHEPVPLTDIFRASGVPASFRNEFNSVYRMRDNSLKT